TAAHFHGPAEPGKNAGVAVAIPSASTSPVEGSATLTDAQAADLEAGKYYVNIHTAANPGGEIRGQVMK
ncbi:MAG: CHRD domain-containing protein, partial [Bradyrhizobium sp.]